MNAKKFAAIIFLIFLPLSISAQSEQGIQGPFYLNTAWNLAKGDVTFQANSKFYFNNKTYNLNENTVNAIAYWDIQGGIGVNYGLGKHYQIGLTQILYQDNHKDGSGYNFPDDLFLDLKVGSFSLKNGSWNLGGKILSRIPLAKHHNILFEPYSAGRLSAGIFGMATYSTKPLFPEDGFNVHFNLGLLDHNDHGVNLDESGQSRILKKHNSREIIGGAALIFPTSKFDFSAEFYGNYYISKPPATAFSRHSYLYFSPGIFYKLFYWLAFGFGFDFRLSPNKSCSSSYISSDLPNHLPTYPLWRLNFKMRVNIISKVKNRFMERAADSVATVEKDEKTIYDKIADEKKHIEEAEFELEYLMKQRQQMDEILARLKKALELKGTEKKEKEKN